MHPPASTTTTTPPHPKKHQEPTQVPCQQGEQDHAPVVEELEADSLSSVGLRDNSFNQETVKSFHSLYQIEKPLSGNPLALSSLMIYGWEIVFLMLCSISQEAAEVQMRASHILGWAHLDWEQHGNQLRISNISFPQLWENYHRSVGKKRELCFMKLHSFSSCASASALKPMEQWAYEQKCCLVCAISKGHQCLLYEFILNCIQNKHWAQA